MQILKDMGYFEILTPYDELKEQLLRIEAAGRTCYQFDNKRITSYTAEQFVRMLFKRGHESVIEHSNLIVRFRNVSRGFTHEMVQHRLCSTSQQSTRYVDYMDIEGFNMQFVVPPHRDENERIVLEDGTESTTVEMFERIEIFYRGLRKAGWLPQDARQILPIGIKSEIIVGANFREWRHIFSMRTQEVAHWEIRSIMRKLLNRLQEIVPVVFDDIQPT